MMKMDPAKRYWVVGGEYRDTSFKNLVDGTEKILGPFTDEQEARRVWTEVATATRSACYTRFSIAEESIR